MTHAQYETGVWYGWNGGECPVHEATIGNLVYPTGYEYHDVRLGSYNWSGPLLFRIVTPYVEPEPKLECWANDYGDGEVRIYYTKYEAEKHATPGRIRCVRMIEADEQ